MAKASQEAKRIAAREFLASEKTNTYNRNRATVQKSQGPAVRQYNRQQQRALGRQKPAKAKKKSGGGGGGFLGAVGDILKNPIVNTTLQTVDLPRSVVASGLDQVAKGIGKANGQAGAGFSWDDFVDNTKHHVTFGSVLQNAVQAEYGKGADLSYAFGFRGKKNEQGRAAHKTYKVKNQLSNTPGVSGAIGLVGDIAVDPLTWLGGVGAAKGGATKLASKLLSTENKLKAAERIAAKEGINLSDDAAKAALAARVDREAAEAANKVLHGGAPALSRAENVTHLGQTGGLKLRVPGTGRIIRGGYKARGGRAIELTLVPQEVTHVITRPLARYTRGLRRVKGLNKYVEAVSGNKGALKTVFRSGDAAKSIPAFEAYRTFTTAAARQEHRSSLWTKLVSEAIGDRGKGRIPAKRNLFKGTEGDAQLLAVRDAIESGPLDANNPLFMALEPKHQQAASDIRDVLEEIAQEAERVGVPFERLDDAAGGQTFFPHVRSKDLKEALQEGGDVKRAGLATTNPIKHRLQAGEEFLGETIQGSNQAEMRASKDAIAKRAAVGRGEAPVDLYSNDIRGSLEAHVRTMSRRIESQEVINSLRGKGIIVDIGATVPRRNATLRRTVDEVAGHGDDPNPTGGVVAPEPEPKAPKGGGGKAKKPKAEKPAAAPKVSRAEAKVARAEKEAAAKAEYTKRARTMEETQGTKLTKQQKSALMTRVREDLDIQARNDAADAAETAAAKTSKPKKTAAEKEAQSAKNAAQNEKIKAEYTKRAKAEAKKQGVTPGKLPKETKQQINDAVKAELGETVPTVKPATRAKTNQALVQLDEVLHGEEAADVGTVRAAADDVDLAQGDEIHELIGSPPVEEDEALKILQKEIRAAKKELKSRLNSEKFAKMTPEEQQAWIEKTAASSTARQVKALEKEFAGQTVPVAPIKGEGRAPSDPFETLPPNAPRRANQHADVPGGGERTADAAQRANKPGKAVSADKQPGAVARTSTTRRVEEATDKLIGKAKGGTRGPRQPRGAAKEGVNTATPIYKGALTDEEQAYAEYLRKQVANQNASLTGRTTPYARTWKTREEQLDTLLEAGQITDDQADELRRGMLSQDIVKKRKYVVEVTGATDASSGDSMKFLIADPTGELQTTGARTAAEAGGENVDVIPKGFNRDRVKPDFFDQNDEIALVEEARNLGIDPEELRAQRAEVDYGKVRNRTSYEPTKTGAQEDVGQRLAAEAEDGLAQDTSVFSSADQSKRASVERAKAELEQMAEVMRDQFGVNAEVRWARNQTFYSGVIDAETGVRRKTVGDMLILDLSEGREAQKSVIARQATERQLKPLPFSSPGSKGAGLRGPGGLKGAGDKPSIYKAAPGKEDLFRLHEEIKDLPGRTGGTEAEKSEFLTRLADAAEAAEAAEIKDMGRAVRAAADEGAVVDTLDREALVSAIHEEAAGLPRGSRSGYSPEQMVQAADRLTNQAAATPELARLTRKIESYQARVDELLAAGQEVPENTQNVLETSLLKKMDLEDQLKAGGEVPAGRAAELTDTVPNASDEALAQEFAAGASDQTLTSDTALAHVDDDVFGLKAEWDRLPPEAKNPETRAATLELGAKAEPAAYGNAVRAQRADLRAQAAFESRFGPDWRLEMQDADANFMRDPQVQVHPEAPGVRSVSNKVTRAEDALPAEIFDAGDADVALKADSPEAVDDLLHDVVRMKQEVEDRLNELDDVMGGLDPEDADFLSGLDDAERAQYDLERLQRSEELARAGAPPKGGGGGGDGLPPDRPPLGDGEFNPDEPFRQGQVLVSESLRGEVIADAHNALARPNQVTLTPAQRGAYMEGALANGMKKLLSDETMMAPDAVADVLNRVNKVMKNPAGVAKVFDDVVQWLKSWQIATPGFHVRNAYGGTFNNLLAGIDPVSSLRGYRRLRVAFDAMDVARRAGKPLPKEWTKLSALEKDAATELHGLVGHGAFGSVMTGVKKGETVHRGAVGTAVTAVAGGRGGAITGASYSVGGSIEEHLRGSLAYDVFMKGGNADDAVEAIDRFHFNYRDLSPAERQIKRVVPFYSWTRHNLPLQLEMLATEPKWAARFQQVKQELESESFADKYAPSWIGSQGVPIQLPFTSGKGGHTLSTPGIPIQDLAKLDPRNTFKEAEGMVTPVAKVPFELFGSGKDTFTGRPLTGGNNQPIPFYLDAIPGAKELLQSTGLASKNKDTGELEMNDKVAHTLDNGLPMFTRLRRLAPNDPKSQNGALTTFLNYTFGGGFVRNNAQDQERAHMSLDYAEARRLVDSDNPKDRRRGYALYKKLRVRKKKLLKAG